MEKRVAEIEEDMQSPSFWDDREKAEGLMAELKGLKGSLNPLLDLQEDLATGNTFPPCRIC